MTIEEIEETIDQAQLCAKSAVEAGRLDLANGFVTNLFLCEILLELKRGKPEEK